MISKKFYKLVIVIEVIQMRTKNMQQWNIPMIFQISSVQKFTFGKSKRQWSSFPSPISQCYSVWSVNDKQELKVMLLFFFCNKCYHRFWILGVCMCVWWWWGGGVKNFNGAKSLVWCLYRILRIWICEVMVLNAAMSVNRF